jgi:DNA primase catalytic core
MIPQETINRVLSATDLAALIDEYVKLSKRGASYVGLCPFHSERTPSFVVSPAKGRYKCFGCGAAGNALTFLQEHEHISFPDAVKRLAARAGIALEDGYKPTPEEQKKYAARESLKAATRWAQEYFASRRDAAFDEYLKKRKLSDKTAQAFGLGYAPSGWREVEEAAAKSGYRREILLAASLLSEGERGAFSYFRNRVMFPICDVAGATVGFTGRAVDGGEKAKYLNSRDSELFSKGKSLFGIHLAKQEIVRQDECYLVEGNFDVLRLHELGFANTVAACGTALTREQAALIRRFTANVTLCYDGDSAGGKATFRNAELLLSEGMSARMVALPDGDDPDSYGLRVGATLLKKLLEEKQDFVTFKYALMQRTGQGDPVAMSAATRDLVRTIALIPDKTSRQLYVNAVAKTFGIDPKPTLAAVQKSAVKPMAAKESGWTGMDVAREAIRKADKCYITKSLETLVDNHAAGRENTIACLGAVDRANIQELNSLTHRIELLDNEPALLTHKGDPTPAAQLCIRFLEFKFDVIVQSGDGDGNAAAENFLSAYANAGRRIVLEHRGDEALRVKLLEQCCELLCLLDETQMTIFTKPFADALGVKDSELKKILKPKLSAKKSKSALRRNLSAVSNLNHALDINQLPDYVDRELLYRRRYFPYQDKNGRKTFYVFLAEDNVSLRVVGNFYIEPLFHVYARDANRNLRVVRINNADSGMTYYTEWKSENLVEFGQFKKLLFNEGGNVFVNGRSADHERILAGIANEFPKCFELNEFGQQHEGFYAFANAILSENEIKYTDELGLVEHANKTYYSPAVSKVYSELRKGNDSYENDRWFVYKESGAADFATWAQLMVEVYKMNHNGSWALLFALMSAFRSNIFPANRLFTAPFFVGPTESGKTQLAVSIRSLFMLPEAPLFNLNSGTDAAFFSSLERYRDVPMVFEEYNDYQISDVKFQGLKAAAYDGEGKQKKKDATSKDLQVSKVNCSLVLLGQEIPERDDNALANRCILLHVPKKDDWTDAERELFDDLKQRERKGLSCVLVEVLRQREVVQKRFAGIFREALKELKADLNATGASLQTRILNTVSLFLATARLWEEHVPSLRLPFTYREFYAIARDKVVSQSESIISTNRVNAFFETMELLLNQQHGGLLLGEQLKLERHKSIMLQNSRSETYEKTLDRETHVLYLRLKLIHPLYAEKKRGEALKMQNLQAYLKDHPAYIGAVKSTRFEWLEYKESADPLNPTLVRKVERRASQNSSAVAMDYEMLKELAGVDFEKYKPESSDEPAHPPDGGIDREIDFVEAGGSEDSHKPPY